MKDIHSITEEEIKSILDKANLGIKQEYRVLDLGSDKNELLTLVGSQTSCCLCGKLPCGESTSMIFAVLRDDGKMQLLMGICKNCKAATNGKSELQIHYLEYLANKNSEIQKRFLMIRGGKAQAFGAPLPGK